FGPRTTFLPSRLSDGTETRTLSSVGPALTTARRQALVLAVAQVYCQPLLDSTRLGAVLAQDPPHPGQRVLVQLPRRRHLPQRAQVARQVVRRAQGVGVILAEHPPRTVEAVLVQRPGVAAVPQPAVSA